jgi:hypothetical protein
MYPSSSGIEGWASEEKLFLVSQEFGGSQVTGSM